MESHPQLTPEQEQQLQLDKDIAEFYAKLNKIQGLGISERIKRINGIIAELQNKYTNIKKSDIKNKVEYYVSPTVTDASAGRGPSEVPGAANTAPVVDPGCVGNFCLPLGSFIPGGTRRRRRKSKGKPKSRKIIKIIKSRKTRKHKK